MIINNEEINKIKEEIDRFDVKPEVFINFLYKYNEVLSVFQDADVKIAFVELLYKRWLLDTNFTFGYAYFLKLINLMEEDGVINSFEFNGFKVVYITKIANYLITGQSKRTIQKRDITTKMLVRSCLNLLAVTKNTEKTNIDGMYKTHYKDTVVFKIITTANNLNITQGVINQWKKICKELENEFCSEIDVFHDEYGIPHSVTLYKDFSIVFITRNQVNANSFKNNIIREKGIWLDTDILNFGNECYEDEIGKYFNYLEI